MKKRISMEGIRKILAPVALGPVEFTRGLVSYAGKLAMALDARLVVANIINSRDVDAIQRISSMGYDVDGEHYVSGIRSERESFLKNIIQKTGLDDQKVRTLIEVGNPIDQLLRIIVDEQIDMVVMGAKGATHLEHVLVGSVASKLFRRSPVTVVSYRDDKMADRLRER
ncbi:MAG: universal stress protein, partial [Desulfococcaceae bacterium]